MRDEESFSFLDPLYGDCQLSDSTTSLLSQPIVQRLRGVRLSNIDSLCMPGVANCSRFEHSLGTANLAETLSKKSGLSESDKSSLIAAAILHDSAMQPYGHLVEEALQYIGVSVTHEDRWRQILQGEDTSNVGGINLQLLKGRQSGLSKWAENQFGSNATSQLSTIVNAIVGQGFLGQAIASDLDLDNLDNVIRAGFHMGLEVQKDLPVRITSKMVISEQNGLRFLPEAVPDIITWLKTRSALYDRFMLSRIDFTGKIMLIAATIDAYKEQVITKSDWFLTDEQFLGKLLNASERSIVDTVERWQCFNLWSLSELFWVKGTSPTYSQINEFSRLLSGKFNRLCLAYRIKDKRNRRISIRLVTGETKSLGTPPSRWLIGVASPIRKDFTANDNRAIIAAIGSFFGVKESEIQVSPRNTRKAEETLFDFNKL